MKRRIPFLFAIIMTGLLLTQCELFLGNQETTGITIDLGDPGDSGTGSARWAIAPPAGIISYTVTVTAADMTMIQKSVLKGTRYLTMEVPTGENRTIRLDANLDPVYMASINREHLLSFAGEKVVDIKPGAYLKLVFYMEAGNSKLLVPNRYNSNFYRTPGMHPAAISDLSFNATAIYDYDLNDSGLIVYSNYSNTIYTKNDIFDNAAAPPSFPTGLTTTNMVTYDAINNRIYTFGTPDTGGQSVIRYFIYPSTTQYSYARPTNIATIAGMEFRDGYLYLIGTNLSGTDCVFRYLPGAATADLVATSPRLNFPFDILVKSDFIYVSNYPQNPYANNPTDYACIEVFDKNTFAFIGSYGTRLPSPSGVPTPFDNRPGYFYGPTRFIGQGNRKIYVIDEGVSTAGGQNRIVAFDDIQTWEGWEVFRTEELDPGVELRYYYC